MRWSLTMRPNRRETLLQQFTNLLEDVRAQTTALGQPSTMTPITQRSASTTPSSSGRGSPAGSASTNSYTAEDAALLQDILSVVQRHQLLLMVCCSLSSSATSISAGGGFSKSSDSIKYLERMRVEMPDGEPDGSGSSVDARHLAVHSLQPPPPTSVEQNNPSTRHLIPRLHKLSQEEVTLLYNLVHLHQAIEEYDLTKASFHLVVSKQTLERVSSYEVSVNMKLDISLLTTNRRVVLYIPYSIGIAKRINILKRK